MTDSNFKHYWQMPPLKAPAGAVTVATAVSIDYLIEAQNDAAEAMFAATRALLEHVKARRTYVTIFSSRNLHAPINALLSEVGPYSASIGTWAFHYARISEIDYDPETDSLHVTAS